MNKLPSLKSPLPFHDTPGSITMEGKIYLRKKTQVHFNTAVHPDAIVFVKVCTTLALVLLMRADGIFW